MAIEFECPSCRGALHVEDESAGRLIRCGACMSTLRVPDAADPEAVPFADNPVSDEPPPLPDREYDRDRDIDRPRRRRRRRPPPPRGKSPLFWILIVFGVVGLGSCALCGLVAIILPGPNWHTHHSAQGGYKVELPAPARVTPPIPGVKRDPNMKMEGAILIGRGEEYAIAYGDILRRNQRLNTDDQLLDAGVKEISEDLECKRVVRDDRITVSGFPAREIEFVGRDGGTYVGRVVVADTRYYILIGGGRFTRPGNANVRRFLDSFKVTDPALK